MDRETTPANLSGWGKLVTLVQYMWDHRTLPTELSWIILVFIPKINTDTQGIVLLKVLWNIVEAVISTQVKMVVQFHDVLHGFCARRGTGVAIMELKMAQDMYIIDQD